MKYIKNNYRQEENPQKDERTQNAHYEYPVSSYIQIFSDTSICSCKMNSTRKLKNFSYQKKKIEGKKNLDYSKCSLCSSFGKVKESEKS